MTTHKKRRTRSKETCAHALMRRELRAQGDGVQIEHYICPTCKAELMFCIYQLRRGRTMFGYNYAPVPL